MKKNIIIVISILLVVIIIVKIINKPKEIDLKEVRSTSNSISIQDSLLDSSEFISLYKANADAILIDVRTPEEYNESHIEGALNIDFYNSNFTNKINELDLIKTYFIYCRSGNRTSLTVPIMKTAGIKNIYELKGGIVEGKELLN